MCWRIFLFSMFPCMLQIIAQEFSHSLHLNQPKMSVAQGAPGKHALITNTFVTLCWCCCISGLFYYPKFRGKQLHANHGIHWRMSSSHLLRCAWSILLNCSLDLHIPEINLFCSSSLPSQTPCPRPHPHLPSSENHKASSQIWSAFNSPKTIWRHQKGPGCSKETSQTQAGENHGK